ncbi:hypothetical protein SAMN04487895_112100 [Paenibacillus sophorae]|uniref:Uncharacterized protein n=1 Tax=Paenibacillus sophorae TaxID=1333845 RepID=A0A1H8SU27_9BACL|nr:hypothetical protein [Paenibacillus sophorae]QWU15558.1 hypothetical protein KP014_27525 [Paenibacillus sophorae]SEO81986.1 hypothetical protein SAMN04487895_112100 [Paenibacillus sophorae]
MQSRTAGFIPPGLAKKCGQTDEEYPDLHPGGPQDGWEKQYKKEHWELNFTNDVSLALPEPLQVTEADSSKWKESYVYGAGGECLSMTYLPAYDANKNTGFEFLMEQANRLRNIYYLAQYKPGWVSILNDCFEWGEVEAFGQKLSCHINVPVITISYFDDDLLELRVFSKGSNTTVHLWCSNETREVYGLAKKQADISVLSNLLGPEYTEEINEILEIDESEEAIEKLQELIQVPLWIHSDWLNDIDDAELKNKYVKYDFNK